MTGAYPRERIDLVLRPLQLRRAYRILLNQYASQALSLQRRRSRFGDGLSYSVLYAAMTFETAFVEVLVRDRFVKRETRYLSFGEIRARSCVEVTLVGDDPLRMVDLRGDGCVRLGAPTDAVHARNHSAGRALGRALYEYPDVDGVLFNSRLTGGENIAVFDRAVGRLAVTNTCELEHHSELETVLEGQQIALIP